VQIVASLDYIATASDEGVLKLPARTELDAEEVKSVFNYPRWASQMHAEIFCADDGSAWHPNSSLNKLHMQWLCATPVAVRHAVDSQAGSLGDAGGRLYTWDQGGIGCGVAKWIKK
jgi:hypothetical protein